MKSKSILITIIFFLTLALSVFAYRNKIQQWVFMPRKSSLMPGVSRENLINSNKEAPAKEKKDIEVIIEELDIPWEVAFLPDGGILVTERSGNLLKVGEEKEVIQAIEGVEHTGEGGLLGMALHPDFEENNYLYLYLTAEAEQNLINRVERYQLIDDHLEDKTVVLEDIAGASYHDGGRMEFGPEGYLYITTGDAGEPDLAQDTNSLSGKILRINDDGTIPEDNPFDNEVYSYGHRNPQGLAWDSQGRLWATEHGPSGAQSGFDELNLIKKGGNYGWPEIRGDQTQQGMINPVIQSGADDTWAPAGLAVKNGILFFAGLRGSSLYQAEIQGEELVKLRANFQNEYGRLRAVRMGPDGYLYFTTSNQDGRGEVRPGDDKLIRVNPTSLTKIEEIN